VVRRSVGFVVMIGLATSGALVSPLSAQADGASSPAAPVTGTVLPTPRATSTSPSPSADPSSSATTSGPPTPAVPTPRSRLAAADPTSAAATATATVLPSQPPLVTTITSAPTSPSLSRTGTFTFTANRAGAQFSCRLRGPGHPSNALTPCPVTGGTLSSTTGRMSYDRLAPSPRKYTFTVRAFIPGVPATGTSTPVSQVDGRADVFSWRVYSVYSRAHYSPPGGARFNNPIGSHADQRRNLTHVIRTINSMPGYKQATQGAPCPTKPSLWPATIRVSLYSMVDGAFSEAARAANRRCISVQVLMNNHLSAATDYSWKRLEQSLGTRVYSGRSARRSFAHRCNYGCRGHGVLHTKMYLFDSTVPAPAQAQNRINNTVMVGSSNITSNASKVQWNDLYTIRGDATVHRDYLQMFNRMKSGRKSSHLYRYSEGMYSSVFWPQGSATDPYRTWLGAVSCTGATGGAGIDGRTVVYVNMHAWFGTRGLKLAHQIRGLYDRGCYVRVLYSFMSFRVFKILRGGTGARMSVRRTMFSHNGRTAYLYSHLKNINISGHVGNDPSTWLVSTGSNNFTNEGTHFDEVALRIRSRAAYNSYVRHFKYMSRRKSSSIYANYSEPTGGGRAP
jgi:hypothetical protein